MAEYFNTEKYGGTTLRLEFRCDIALILISHFGSVAATISGEDTAGRSKMILQTPEELVIRCFKIADLFVDEVEKRGGIKILEDVRKK